MGTIYAVIPLGSEHFEWLDSLGAPHPAFPTPSRNPTPAEVRETLESLPDLSVEYSLSPSQDWQADIATTAGAEAQWTLLNISGFQGETVAHSISFSKGSPELILRVLIHLCRTTGPLLLVADSGDPVVVSHGDQVDQLMRVWEYMD